MTTYSTDPAATGTSPAGSSAEPAAGPSRHGPLVRELAADTAPVGLEPAARAVDRRAGGTWRAPIAAAAATYGAVVVGLVAVGLLLVHTPIGGPVRSWDETLSRDISLARSSGWSDYSSVGTSGANTLPVIGGMLVVTAVLAALRRWRDLLLVPLGLALELSMFLSVNYLVDRARPDVSQLGGQPSTNSFPSGHVAATFVLAVGVALLLGVSRWRWPLRLLGWAVAAVPVLTVAFSRVYRGMHYTTDVLGGMLLGALALAGAVVATRASWLGAHHHDAGEAR